LEVFTLRMNELRVFRALLSGSSSDSSSSSESQVSVRKNDFRSVDPGQQTHITFVVH